MRKKKVFSDNTKLEIGDETDKCKMVGKTKYGDWR